MDKEAQNIPHSEEKYAADGNTEITIGPAPDDVTLTIREAENYRDAVLAMATGDEGVNIIWAKDIDVSGELESEVTVTITDPAFRTLSDDAVLYHIVDGVAYEVPFTLDRETGTITFKATSFSPYAITVPDVSNPSTANDEAELELKLGPEARVKNGDLQTPVTAASPQTEFGIVLDADATWNITNWGSVNNLEIRLNGHSLNGDIEVPAGKTLTITGASDSAYQRVNGKITAAGNVVLAGRMAVPGDITLNSGSLYVDGGNVAASGTITSNSGFVQISTGSYGTLVASGGGGHITGGTYDQPVPNAMLASGYACKPTEDGKRYVVYQADEARVKTINGTVNFSRNGGNYYEFCKGDANSSANYSFQYAVTPGSQFDSVTLIDPSGTTHSLTGMYTFTSDVDGKGTGRVIINKDSVKSLLNSVPAGRGYFQFSFKSGTILIDAPLNIYPDITCNTDTYIIDSFQPVVFTLTDLNPIFITVDKADADNAYDKLFTDYTTSGNQLLPSTTYLNNLTPGQHNFDFWYAMDYCNPVRLRWTITVARDYKITRINGVNMYKDKNQPDSNWYQYSGRNLDHTANGDSSKFVGVNIDGKRISYTNYALYTHVPGETTVGLYPGYLATLPQGKHTIELVFTDGTASATFNVLGASASPKTGDNNHVGLWVGLLVLSGAAVVALIPKKKKQ